MSTLTTRSKPTPAASSSVVNGIDVAHLQASIEAIKAEPAKGKTTWHINSSWVGGTRTDHHVKGFSIGGDFVERAFVINIDEPRELEGTNRFANPQEHLLAALNACMMVGYSAVAALMGITLTKLEVETTGDIDLRGFLGISDRVAPGYVELDQVVRIAGNATAEQFTRLHEIVRSTSPNFFNITRAIPTNSRMIVE
ncbi:MAG: OsmC family protein [Phycisphaeraceae bacterium]|nr:OsmC family protein [Phycisphaeraceae bacterium]